MLQILSLRVGFFLFYSDIQFDYIWVFGEIFYIGYSAAGKLLTSTVLWNEVQLNYVLYKSLSLGAISIGRGSQVKQMRFDGY